MTWHERMEDFNGPVDARIKKIKERKANVLLFGTAIKMTLTKTFRIFGDIGFSDVLKL